MNPEYGADFPSCIGKDDPGGAVRSEIESALGGIPYSGVSTSHNVDTNAIDVGISGGPEGWSISFSIDLEGGSVVNFPPYSVDGR